MNYITDKPIERVDQDCLGRASFSKQLGESLYQYSERDGLVIGLYGKWGTGKTSVINMALTELETLSTDSLNKPVIVRFSPWNYSDKNNLIGLFFHCLISKIDSLKDNSELKMTVGKALSDYAGALDALALIPLVGPGVAAILKALAQGVGENLLQEADLDKTKTKLEEALASINNKIIVVIDDIDRLTNSQIRDIFQLVKQVADFPNVIYILSMDRDVVRSALSEVHKIDGDEYLEKIIQVPFELPDIHKDKIKGIFFDKLNHIISELPGNVRLV